ncbi:MAG: hypothetical protein QXD98_01640 [Candidatus Diapherotrites archaeon]
MKIKNKKSQGALEYLLLIGGGVVLAATVIALILGNSSTQSGMADKSHATQLCALKATQAKTPPSCSIVKVIPGAADISHIYVKNTKTCWQCTGNYPKCIAEKIGVMDNPSNCGGGNNIEV